MLFSMWPLMAVIYCAPLIVTIHKTHIIATQYVTIMPGSTTISSQLSSRTPPVISTLKVLDEGEVNSFTGLTSEVTAVASSTLYTSVVSDSFLGSPDKETISSSPSASTSSTSATLPSSSEYTSATNTAQVALLSSISSDFSQKFTNSSSILWDRFWTGTKFTSKDLLCDTSFTEPSVWELAVVSRAIIQSNDIERTNEVLTNLYQYENQNLGQFSASTAGDNDIYNDDNAQIAWSFIDGYKLTGNQQYLASADKIVKFLMNQVNDKGGVIWHYQQSYIASISTIEAALAAMRLYEITKDENLIEFAKRCVAFLFTYLQDPNDKLFYDGLNNGDYDNINKGKLTYTAGVCLSTLSLLYKYDRTDEWMIKITEIGDAVTDVDGAFYNGDGLWNNAMKYSHLLFVGLNDIYQMGVTKYNSSVLKQGNYVSLYLQDSDELFLDTISDCPISMIQKYQDTFDQTVQSKSLNYCNGTVTKVLMDNGAALQILYQMSRNY